MTTSEESSPAPEELSLTPEEPRPATADSTPADPPPTDPKEAMREALLRKQNASRPSNAPGIGTSKAPGGPHGKAAAKRQFRRKSGG